MLKLIDLHGYSDYATGIFQSFYTASC